MMPRGFRLRLALLLVVVIGCTRERGLAPDPMADAWVRLAPRELNAGAIRALPDEQFSPVSEDKRIAAVELLGDASWRQITALQAVELSGTSFRIGPGDVVVILRGVETMGQPESNQFGGSWKVDAKDGIVLVHHRCNRTFPWNLRSRRPVVAVLDALPKEVYVGALVAY